MGYQALYRTYRPSNFEKVAGQKHIVKTLKNAIEKNKIAHAYLFCGPRGTGKTSIAKIFAKAVNCTNDDQKPCGVCDNCKAIAEGNHPDIIEIDAASNNGVDEVRSLIEKVKYSPIEGKYKVYIIDEVHMMSTGAFNALLKTIEEPPAHVIFILATTEPQKVLPTIISRCQRFDFNRVLPEDMVPYLKSILEKENIKCEDEVIRIISQLADGGMRDSLSILDQCIAYAQNNIQVKHINEIYGITTVRDKLNIIQWIKNKDISSLMDKLSEMNEKGTDIKRLTIDLINLLKETIVFEYTEEKSLLKSLTNDEVYEIIDLLGMDERLSIIDILLDTSEKYRTASNIFSYFEIALLKCMNINPIKAVLVKTESKIENKKIENKKSNSDVSRETIVKQEIDVSEVIIEDEIDFDEPEPIMEEQNHEMNQVNEIEETNIEIESSIKPLKDELIIRLLAGANKPEKNKDLKYLNNIQDYLYDLKWAKYANILNDGTIIASGPQYIVFCVDNEPLMNEINELDKDNQFLSFTSKLFEKNKKVFAITADQQKRVINQFKQAMATNTLPEPITFEELELCKEEVKKEKTEVELVEDLFGKENIVIMEE